MAASFALVAIMVIAAVAGSYAAASLIAAGLWWTVAILVPLGLFLGGILGRKLLLRLKGDES